MFRIAWRMITHDKLKSAGTLFGVFFAVTLISQQIAVFLGLTGLMVALPSSIEADLWILPEKAETIDFGNSLPEQLYQQALGTEGVAWAEPIYMGTGSFKKLDGSTEVVRIFGSAAPRFAAGPHPLYPGTQIESLREPNTIFIDWQDRKKLGNPNLGDWREINNQRVRIAGFTDGLRPFGIVHVFSSLENARKLSGPIADGRISFVILRAAPGYSVAQLRTNLQERLSNVAIYTSQEAGAMSRSYWLTRTAIGLNFGTQIFFAMIVGFAIVALTLFSSVVDRLREFGTMKAIGAQRKDLRRLLLAQATIYAGLGYSLGTLAFVGISNGMMKAGGVVQRPPELFLGVALFTLFLCVSSALFAARRVLKLEPAIVFRG